MTTYKNRTAVVTGGAGYIGKALCKQLAQEGVKVALCDLTLEIAQKAADEIAQDGVTVYPYAMDVCSTESVNNTAAAILKDFGKVDILINNAGVWKYQKFLEMSEEKWHKSLDINLNGPFRVTKAFAQQMVDNGYGRIINTTSIAGEVGLPGQIDYASSKAGLIMFTKTLAMELGRTGVTVNCVSPGMVTPDPMLGTKTTWVERTCTADEVANVIAFLASDETSFITGADYSVDGGRILGPRFSDI